MATDAQKLRAAAKKKRYDAFVKEMGGEIADTTPRKLKPKPKVKRKRITKVNFYKSDAWLQLRYKALTLHGAACQCCGMTRKHGVVLHVDHIKPRSTHPHLQLDINNLQILCEDCNLGKSNLDDTDWR